MWGTECSRMGAKPWVWSSTQQKGNAGICRPSSVCSLVFSNIGSNLELHVWRVTRAATAEVLQTQVPSGRLLHFVSKFGGILGPDESLHQECTPEDGAPPFTTGRAAILYTDASDAPGRECGRYLVCAVFDSPRCPDLLWTTSVIPEIFVPTWVSQGHQDIGQL